MIMTTLFRRLQPTQKFRISIGAIAKHAALAYRAIAENSQTPDFAR
jgi:hypothetical protein